MVADIDKPAGFTAIGQRSNVHFSKGRDWWQLTCLHCETTLIRKPHPTNWRLWLRVVNEHACLIPLHTDDDRAFALSVQEQ